MSNLLSEFLSLFPSDPLLVGEVSSITNEVRTVTLPDGSTITAKGVASPYAQDVISISIETPTSIWMSQRPIRLLPPSKKRRAFDLPAAGDFQRYTEAAGRFSGLLPNSQLIDPTSG
jgi:hypothetical protein